MIFDILFLPLVIFIGLITSYEDVRHGKVRNKWILLGLGWGFLAIVFFYLWHPVALPLTRFFSPTLPVFTVSISYLNKVLLNASVSLLVAYLMWKAGAWAAGDAKLFFVYALLLPLKYYWKSYLPVFPSFVLLINIFLPILVYLLLRSVFFNSRYFYYYLFKPEGLRERKRKRKKEEKKQWPKKVRERLIMAMAFISIFLLFGMFEQLTFFQSFIFAAIIIFSGSLANIFEKTITFWLVFGVLVSVFSYGLAVSPAATWQSFYQSVLMMAIFMTIWGVVRKMIDFHILKTSIKEISLDDLRPGMNVDENIIAEIKKDEKYRDKIGSIYPEGLTGEQVKIFIEFFKKKKNRKIVKIYQPFPFVAWMLFGLIITIILKSSLFHFFIVDKSF